MKQKKKFYLQGEWKRQIIEGYVYAYSKAQASKLFRMRYEGYIELRVATEV